MSSIMKKTIYLILLLFLQTSCDRVFMMSGHITDNYGKPLENAEIRTSENVTIYSDSLGYFELNLFGPGSKSDKLETLVSKEGYEATYFDLSKEKDIYNLSLKIKASEEKLVATYSESLVRSFYYINLTVINLLALFTIYFVLYKRVKHKWIWLLLILTLNITLQINYINGLWSINMGGLPFYIKYYAFYPFTIKIACPIAIILFWINYFFGNITNIQKGNSFSGPPV